MDINFELYKIFYHAAKSGNFSVAAQQLYITQSAVSQAVKNLENQLGVNLFFRKTRHLKLTPEGELLFSHIEQAFNFIKTAEHKITELQNLDSGEIRIGASDTVCKYYLLPFIDEFTRQYPQIKFQLINRTTAQIVEVLKQGIIDFGIVTLPLEHNNIATYELSLVEDVWVASHRFDSLKDQILTLPQLTHYPLLLLDQNSATRRNLDLFFQQHQIRVQPEIELESVDLLVEFAKIGRGIAHVLRESALVALNNGELFEVRIAEPLPSRKLGAIVMKNVPLSQAAQRFVRLLQE
ncbi:MAG TPA: LysR family transcriptional regulator [Bacillota bacterium]|nr:LysR family transcriptional regulator [Bacillota bacterium]